MSDENMDNIGSCPAPNENDVYDEVNSEDDDVFSDAQWIDDDTIAAANARAREEGTTKGYHAAVGLFLKWVIANKDKNVCSDVLQDSEGDDGVLVFDVERLGKSMETIKGPYFQYTRQYQLRMQRAGKSGMGGIATLRSAVTDFFVTNRCELSQQAIQTLKTWGKSRRRDDMAAKMRPDNPIQFSNARDDLPTDAYQKIAEVMSVGTNVQLWVMFILQWNMISRVSQVSHMMFNFMSWSEDHFVAKHGSSKSDQKGTRSFPMAIMANRYVWYICPITAMAIWMSVTQFPDGGNKLFPGSDPAAAYGKWLKNFLVENATALIQWAALLLGTHSVRKGATNAGAQEGLVADTLVTTLIRGLWDIGDTLQRYFKANKAGDAMVARILAGHSPMSTSFRALPPHFVTTTASQERAIGEAVKNQFNTNNPLMKKGTASQKNALKHCLASLVHHYSTLHETLDDHHPLRETWIFTCEDNKFNALFAMLGPEFEEPVDGRFTLTTGIPPVVQNMVQNEQEHKATRVELEKLKSDLGHVASSIGQLRELIETTQTTLQQITTQGITTVGPEQMQLMLTKAMQGNTHGNERLTNMEKDIATILQRYGVAPLPPDHDEDEADNDNDDDNSAPLALDLDEPSGADTMAKLVRHDPKSYSWAHHDKKKRKKDKTIRFRKLPLDYKLPLKLSLTKVFQRFVTQSGTSDRPIPRLATIHFASAEFSLPSAQSHFKKAKTVTTLMLHLLHEDEAGRTLIKVFEKSSTIASLTEMSDEAQRRLLGDLPPPKKRQKRSNPENLTVGSVYQFLSAARKKFEARRAAMSSEDEDDDSEDDEDDDSNSEDDDSSSEEEDEADEEAVRSKKRQRTPST